MPYKDPEKRRECNKKSHFRRYHLRSDNGLCSYCGKKAIVGLKRCAYCSYKKSICQVKLRQQNKPQKAIENQKQRQRYKDTNRCLRCSAPLMEEDSSTCVNCRIYGHFPLRTIKRGYYEVNKETVTSKP